MIGRTLGHYRITAKLGEGGMGVVYRARDTRLGREVALKVLPAGFVDDPERHARFEREAKMLASLNHPNIAVLYGLEHLDGQHALVMELVEGEGLDERIARGPIPIEEAISIVLQVTEALEAAHEKGIVHRDLKPANVMVRSDGAVKVLDFGLAKAREAEVEGSDPAQSPTVTGVYTKAGVILGTVAYMSPEQARGTHVDKRSDIWAFGCVLYEMLSGRKAFAGETVPDVMAAIMTREPDWGALPPGLETPVRTVLRRCLERNSKNRLHDIADARIVLDDALAGRSDMPAGAPARAAHRGRRGVPWFGLGAALLAGAALVTVAARAVLTPRAVTWRGDRLVGGSVLAYGPRSSPDGSLVAFLVVGEDRQSQVAVIQPGESRWTVLTHDLTAGPVLALAWSRDGRVIYYSRPIPDTVFSVPVMGGQERVVVENARFPEALPDGSLVVERRVGGGQVQLLHVWPDQAREQAFGPRFAELSNPGLRTGPRAFADGREVVYFGLPAGKAGDGEPGLHVIDVATGAARRLAPELEFPTAERNALLPAVAVDSVRNEVLVVVPRGDLHVVCAIPRSGRGRPRTLLNLTAPAWALDVGPYGALYVDQVDVLGTVLHFDASGGTPRHVARFAGSPARSAGLVQLPDGGILFTSVQSGRSALMVAQSGHGVTRFVETDLETSGPAALLGASQVAFLIGPESKREIAIASLTGRIQRRIPAPSSRQPTAFADLGDGRQLLFGDGERVLAVNTTNGASRELAVGESATVDPQRGELLVLDEGHNGEIVKRIGLDGTLEEELPVPAEIYLESWVGPMIDRADHLLVTVGLPDSWFVGPGVLTLATRQIRRIPLDFYGDVFTPTWARDGSILAIGWEYSANVWRFVESGRARREASRP